MIMLLLKTDQPTSEVWLYEDERQLTYYQWAAHRQLSDTLLSVIKQQLDQHKLAWSDIDGVGVYAGPGSFTGLRISHSFANALAYSLDIAVVNAQGDQWLEAVIDSLLAGNSQKIITPAYGRNARITKQKK